MQAQLTPWGTHGIRRTFAAADVAAQTDKAMLDLPCFWPEDWVAAEQNYAIIDNDGNIALLYNGTSQAGAISVAGSTTTYGTTSDYRLKTEAPPPAGYSAVGTVLELAKAMRWYGWNGREGRELGWFAHELQAVEPRAVTGEKDAVDGDGNPVLQSRDDSKLIPHLVAAVAHLLREIETLKAGKTK